MGCVMGKGSLQIKDKSLITFWNDTEFWGYILKGRECFRQLNIIINLNH